MRMLRFKLIRLRGLKLGRPVSAVWFDSNAAEIATAEQDMYFSELLVCQCYSSGELKRMLGINKFV